MNSRITVPSNVCALQVSTKTLQLTKFCSDQKISILKGPCFLTFLGTMKNVRARALPLFSNGPHSMYKDVSKMLQSFLVSGGGDCIYVPCTLNSSESTFYHVRFPKGKDVVNMLQLNSRGG